MEGVLLLARLHLSTGDAARATRLLDQLDASLQAHELTLPEGRAAHTGAPLLYKASAAAAAARV
jgi:hypothetical protein